MEVQQHDPILAKQGSQLEQSGAVAFGGFGMIAEVQQLFLDHASVHVVYRDRQVLYQSIQFKRIEERFRLPSCFLAA